MNNGKYCGIAKPCEMARALAVIGIVGALGACGGGGGSAPAVIPPTVLGVVSPRASEGIAGGEAVLAFRVALADAVAYPLTVAYGTSSAATGSPTSARVGAACTAGVDYYIPVVANLTVTVNTANNTATGVLTIPTAAASRQVNVMVCPNNSATDKVITFGWNGGNATASATGTILGAANGDLAGSDRLNDTGITACADGAANGLSCPQTAFPGQDAQSGRDADTTITGTGASRTSAFVFTVLAAGVIQDSRTGLMWESKTTDGGLHDINSTFTWFNSSAGTNGGATGTAAGGACTGVVPGGCDTEKFVAAVNAEALGGFSNWRLPTAQELSTLVDSGDSTAPTIDAAISNQFAGEYWSASPKSQDTTGAWVVDFNSGAIAVTGKNIARRVRLVRGR